MVEGENSHKSLAPSLLRFWSEGNLKMLRKMITQGLNELMTKVFLEQPRQHRVC